MWFRALFQTAKRPAAAAQLLLEVLDDRLVPSAPAVRPDGDYAQRLSEGMNRLSWGNTNQSGDGIKDFLSKEWLGEVSHCRFAHWFWNRFGQFASTHQQHG
jgi:hypothetical protein